jgi:pyridoxine 5'-phosphate synthase PdxJ
VQNRNEPGPGVLRVNVDCIATQRTERDLGGAEPGFAVHLESAGLEQLREHLGEQIRFAERL